MIQMKNETIMAAPHLMPLEATKTSLWGKARNISMMLENNQPIKPAMRITDQRSWDMTLFFPRYV